MQNTEEQIEEIIVMSEEISGATEGAEYERVKLCRDIMCGTKYPYLAAPELLEQLEALVAWAKSKNAFAITAEAERVIARAKGEV